MKKGSILFLIAAAVVVCLLCFADPALAAPGGKIASAMFRTVPGRIFLGILVLLFLPLILYVQITEAIAVNRTRRDLRLLAATNREFDWLQLKERVTDAFNRVHAAWRKEDMHEASAWMTDWYWQNQQLAHLDQWERDGLINHCRVKSISNIRPLFIRYCNEDGKLDGSRLVVSITAVMEDYLAERATGKVVEGKKGYTDVESVWTMVYERDRWLVANIEEGSLSLEYAKLVNELSALGSPQGAYQTR
jgi:hypothetical protein